MERDSHARNARARRTARAKDKFIEALAQSCNVSFSARVAGIGRRTAYDWRDEDPDFAARWQDAEEEAGDRLEQEAWRRAVEGTDKPITFQGAITGTYKEYSDRMLELLLKAHKSDKFVDRYRAEHTGRNGGPIQHEQVVSDADAFTGRISSLAARTGTGSGAGETQH